MLSNQKLNYKLDDIDPKIELVMNDEDEEEEENRQTIDYSKSNDLIDRKTMNFFLASLSSSITTNDGKKNF